ncbi:MAG: DUF1592 domain-containing protein [Planctomycetota bacterium]
MKRFRSWLLAVWLAAAFLLGSIGPVEAVAASPEAIRDSDPRWSDLPMRSVTFLQDSCIDCHDGPGGEGGFDASNVTQDASSHASMHQWVRIVDRVRSGEMPPPEDSEIDESQRRQFLETTSRRLISIQRDQFRREGRVRARRLTNEQLERTLQDLLCVDLPLSRLMPAEQRTDGFVHLADAQPMSHFQLQSHLRVVDAALEAAFDRAQLPEDDLELDYGPEKIADKRPGQRNRSPEMRKGAAVVWSSGLVFYGRIPRTEVRRSGWFDITLTASCLKAPKDGNVWCSIRSGECVSSAPLMTWVGGFEATPEPKEVSFRAWIPADHMIEVRPADITLKRGRQKNGQVGFGELEPQNVPGVAMHRLVMRQVHPGGAVDEVRDRLFGSLSMKWDPKAKRSRPDVASMSPQQQSDELGRRLSFFAELAYRRPAGPESIESIVQLSKSLLRDGASFTEALRAGYRTILCSPRFLYFVEPADPSGRLDDWAVASRLSYFLTGSMPDKPLRRAAAEGRLQSPRQRANQVDRLLRSRRGKSFVADFADQWLDLVNIDFTEPDRRLHPQFDILVQNGMLQETRCFLQQHFDENLPVTNLFDADYTFLNERLARFYDIPGVQGDQMRPVQLDPQSPRGGLFSQGSILKVTAAGNDTSPVLRGIWVSERLLGVEIPPPPASVPAVEPDIRGATTIRELLAKHQSDSNCAACHKNIDPPGFALEMFDAAGQWRSHYVRKDGRKYVQAAQIDPSGVMPDGDSFDTFQTFRSTMANQPELLASNLAQKLLVYGTGAPIAFADRESIQSIVDRTKADQYGVRSILHEVVSSDPFLTK